MELNRVATRTFAARARHRHIAISETSSDLRPAPVVGSWRSKAPSVADHTAAEPSSEQETTTEPLAATDMSCLNQLNSWNNRTREPHLGIDVVARRVAVAPGATAAGGGRVGGDRYYTASDSPLRTVAGVLPRRGSPSC